MPLPPKPAYTHPCNNCGVCCTLSLCEIGKMAYPSGSAPCPSLVVRDGRALCGFVLMEKAVGATPLIANALGIGCGCSMPDEETTEEQIEKFDRASLAEVRSRNLTNEPLLC